MENVDKSAKSCGHMSCKSIFVLGFAKRDTFTFKTVSFQLEFEYCPLVDFLFPIVGFYVKLNEKDKQTVLIEVISESHLQRISIYAYAKTQSNNGIFTHSNVLHAWNAESHSYFRLCFVNRKLLFSTSDEGNKKPFEIFLLRNCLNELNKKSMQNQFSKRYPIR
ncbi:hypothetical protein T4B_1688 [Trichinella pseudospiralis]|uniref:Uncharacterized protein n=1 Tax=Trichinella pseudospiralis TaxID=6337 RepID=A0A0V1IJV7_TRIPS|nr:hypothetical protein T4B_1688 [Trichinella pseudospiralis]